MGAGQAVGSEWLWREFHASLWNWWDDALPKVGMFLLTPYIMWMCRRAHFIVTPSVQESMKFLDLTLRSKAVHRTVSLSSFPHVKSGLAAMTQEQAQDSGLDCKAPDGKCKRKQKIGDNDLFGTGRDEDALCSMGEVNRGLHFLNLTSKGGFRLRSDNYVRLLQECIHRKSLVEGQQVHDYIIKVGFQSDVIVTSTLMNMYIKCGSIKDAGKVFGQMPVRDVVSWNVMIAGYSKCGRAEDAIKLFWEMRRIGVKPSKITFVSVFKACSELASLDEGRRIHTLMQNEITSDAFLDSTLVHMYAKCGTMEEARQVFDKMLRRDVVSWTVMIAGYANSGQSGEAIKLFQQMQQEATRPNKNTFGSILKACANPVALDRGRKIHVDVIKYGFDCDIIVVSSLVDMYAKCRSIGDARDLFNKLPERDVVLYNVMLAGYVEDGHGKEAFELFSEMQDEGMKPDNVTLISIIKACVTLSSLEMGKQVHANIIMSGFGSDISVGTTLIYMYAKCGSIEHARRVFDKLLTHNVVSWSAMIAGYAQHRHGEEALKLFWKMQDESFRPNEATFVSVLKACAHVGALGQGRQIHAQIMESEFGSNLSVGSSLIDMYGKCGSMEGAWQVFDNMPGHDVVSWTAIIAGYAQHGHGKEALQLVKKMLAQGVKPDHVTFMGILSACSHIGLVNDGLFYFNSMSQDHGITPTVEHHACVVDLLGRAGHLAEAEDFIKRFPNQSSAMIWTALLGACRIHGNVELAKRASECLLALEPENTSAFVLLSNVYARVGMWESRDMIRKMMEDRGVKKEVGCSYTEVDNKVHAFFGEDALHPQMKEIHAELKRLLEQMKSVQLVPEIKFLWHDIEEMSTRLSPCYHSDKFALSFGLISTPPGTPIRIFKNLPACINCHTFAKFLSQIVGRHILVRDANHFHHFRDGVCSCRDLW